MELSLARFSYYVAHCCLCFCSTSLEILAFSTGSAEERRLRRRVGYDTSPQKGCCTATLVAIRRNRSTRPGSRSTSISTIPCKSLSQLNHPCHLSVSKPLKVILDIPYPYAIMA